MVELRHDLTYLARVQIPTYLPDVPPPRLLGDLPPWRITLVVVAAIFGFLILLGLLAETLHRTLPPR